MDLDIEYERAKFYDAILSADHTALLTRKQVLKLIILFQEALVDKSDDTRKGAMAVLIGKAVKDALHVRFNSFKNMSSAIASMLIDQFTDESGGLNEYGRTLIRLAETTYKATLVQVAPAPVP